MGKPVGGGGGYDVEQLVQNRRCCGDGGSGADVVFLAVEVDDLQAGFAGDDGAGGGVPGLVAEEDGSVDPAGGSPYKVDSG